MLDAMGQLRCAIDDIGIGAYNAASWRIEKAIGLIGQSAPSRGALARIIDPTAKFEDLEGVTWSKFEIQRRELAYRTADAVLAILNVPQGAGADRFVTVLTPEDHAAFLSALDSPPAPSAALVKLMKGADVPQQDRVRHSERQIAESDLYFRANRWENFE